MATITDTTSLGVCVTEGGSVWYGAGNFPPCKADGVTLEDFAKLPVCRLASTVCVPGHARYAPLIMRLLHRQALLPVRVYLCRPLSPVTDPRAVLFELRQNTDAPSRGGHIEVGPAHRRILAAVQAASILPDNPGELQMVEAMLHCRNALEPLPIYRLLRCLGSNLPIQIAILLGVILDPRLFIDPADPDSQDRLEKYLGLSAEHDDHREVPERMPASGSIPRRHRRALIDLMWTCPLDPHNLNEPCNYFPRYYRSL
jgi:hypothetical protein